MKRSRYNATMSRCLGSANQSRERKRRLGVSDAMGHDSLRKSRHVDARAEQSTGERLRFPFLGAERDMRGSDVKGLEIVVTEGGLGDGGAGQAQRTEQRALRRITLQAPATEHAGPDAALGVHDGAIRVTGTGRQACEHALVR